MKSRANASVPGLISSRREPTAAVEVLVATPTTSKLIEEGRTGQLYSAIAEGGFFQMQTMNQCLVKYFKAGLITEEEAFFSAGNLTELKQMIRRP